MTEVPRGTPKKQRFLQGAAVLTLGALVVKLLGALYKIPLTRLIGPEGFGHFHVAYGIFNFLLTVSTAGLPVALSRMIARAEALGDRPLAEETYRIGRRLFLLLGALSSGAMVLLARPLAEFMRDPEAAASIAVLGPSVIFLCLASALRGYFQGQQYMTPTAVSQVLEALARLGVGLGAALLLLRRGAGSGAAAAGAIAGVTCGSVLSAVYLHLEYRRRRAPAPTERRGNSGAREILRNLVRLAVPITLGAAGMQLIYAVGGRVILGRLQDGLGLSAQAAAARYGLYAAAQTFYMLPMSLITPMAVSIIPAVTEALTRADHPEARALEESALRMATLAALPCGAGLMVLSSPIQALCYGYGPEDLALAGPLLGILGLAVPGGALAAITAAILQAHGYMGAPVISTAVGGAVCLTLTGGLAGRADVGILAAPLGVLACGAAATALNLVFLSRLPCPPRILRQLGKPLAAAGLMALAAAQLYLLLRRTVPAIPALAGTILGAVFSYGVLICGLRLITWEDCRLLPRGQTLAKLLGVTPAPSDSTEIH